MIDSLIAHQTRLWLERPNCPAAPLLAYMRSAGYMRDVQISAIQTYLYLLLEGNNQSLTALWLQGKFVDPARPAANYGGPRSRMPQVAQDVFATQPAAHTWYQLLQTQHSAIATWLEDHADDIDYQALTNELFYGWQNTDYVFSLPMGAGKTWLMAAIIYLNLYLAEQHPGDARFAQNFACLIPSAKKSSILPSLRSIERFNPAWLLPEPAASRLKQALQFEVLDAAKTAAKSNQIRNPNARKLAAHLSQPGLCGLVLVVNAEKVILDRIEDVADVLIVPTDDERDLAANELRTLMGRIPGLLLMVDEVHGAATSEIKLRQVIQGWHRSGNVHSVLGFSGTPYLDKPQELQLGPHTLKQKQISTVVFHYPLTEAVRLFLKQPEVKTAHGLSATQIVAQGTAEFMQRYGATVYSDGCSAKLAIYCGTIERLETEIAPLVEQFAPGQVLKYHRGNAQHKAPHGAEAAFTALDTPGSPHRIVLLVQIGKEGWDCRSLTGVILAQKGDSPANMVLQSACRCLREVARGQRHTALIYLSADNAQILEAQLKQSQNTSIAALNAAALASPVSTPVYSRMGWLKSMAQLPLIEAYQLRLQTQTRHIEADPQTTQKLGVALAHASQRTSSAVTTGTLANLSVQSQGASQLGAKADFADWLHTVLQEALGTLAYSTLAPHTGQLQTIFEALTERNAQGVLCYALQAPQSDVRRLVRLAFWCLRSFDTQVTSLDDTQAMLLLKTGALPSSTLAHDKLYPQAADVAAIMAADALGQRGADISTQGRAEFEAARALLQAQGLGHMLAAQSAVTAAPEFVSKDHSFHYLPYDFAQSGLELGLLQELLKSKEFQASGLEVYYNGARHLTDFRIDCYQQVGNDAKTKRWQKLGAYTPDFLMLQRAPGGSVGKVLIIEAKGAGFAEQSAYTLRKQFVSSEFLRLNNDKFGYPRFDFIEVIEPPNHAYRAAAQTLFNHAAQFFAQPLTS